MYKYTICSQPDEKLFFRQCAAFEKHIPDLQLISELQDVDSSLIRVYRKDAAK